MIFLILSIICSVFIGNLLILFSKDKKSDILTIFAGNYFLATIFSFLQQTKPFVFDSSFAIILGSITGFLFLINFIVYQKNINLNGLSLSVGIMRVSLLIPILISILLFKDNVSPWNYLGIGIVVIAFFFMAETKSLHNLFWLFILFILTGIADSTMKIFNEYGKGKSAQFISFIFFSALIINLFLLFIKLIKGRKLKVKYFFWGMLLGVPNQLTTKFFLISLNSVPAAIAYPLFAASIVFICFIADKFIWKKKYTYKQRWALVFILIGIIFLNIR